MMDVAGNGAACPLRTACWSWRADACYVVAYHSLLIKACLHCSCGFNWSKYGSARPCKAVALRPRCNWLSSHLLMSPCTKPAQVETDGPLTFHAA